MSFDEEIVEKYSQLTDVCSNRAVEKKGVGGERYFEAEDEYRVD